MMAYSGFNSRHGMKTYSASQKRVRPCPHCCHKTFDPGDVPWTCPKCGHMGSHWDAKLNCEACRFSPDDTTDMPCPHCRAAINVMGFFFTKQQRYRMRDFLISDNKLIVTPEAQNARVFPFARDRARRFFMEFKDVEFDFNGQIGFILIHTGKENLPSHSIADGFLFEQTFDEYIRLGRLGALPKPIG